MAHYNNQIGKLTERNTAHREAAAAAKEAYTQADKTFHAIDVKIRAVADCGDPIKVHRLTGLSSCPMGWTFISSNRLG